MQYFISTFIIMLICIIALLQDKSYDAGGVVLSRPQNKFPNPQKSPSIKCNNVSHIDLSASPQLFIDKNESQTEVFAALLAEKLINPSISNKAIVTSTKNSAATNLNGEKCLNKEESFCFRCDLNSFTPDDEHFKHSLRALHNQ